MSRISKIFRIFALFALLPASLVLAQAPPQAGAVASIFGGSPEATIYAGARVDNGPYVAFLERTSDFQLEVQVDPVATAVGSSGKAYVVVMTAGPAFTLLESGEWIAFDGTVEGLGGAKSITSYGASNAFTVNNLSDLFVKQGMPIVDGEVALSVFIAYDAVSLSGDVHYTSTPLSLTLVDSGLQRDALLPELPNPSSLTGAATTAHFFGGASLTGSSDFNVGIFDSSADVEITLEFMPEISQFDSPGKAFVVAFAGGVPHTLNESGQWSPWDGSVEGLLSNAAASYPELLSYHQIDISSAAGLVDRDGVQVQDDSVAFQVFIAYQSDAVPGQLYYSGTPLQFSVASPTYRDAALEYYQQNIEQQIVQTRCIACHVEGGTARTSGLIFQRPGSASALNNFAAFETFLGSRNDAVEWILIKASGGEDHTGGVQLPVGGADYNAMETFLGLLSPRNEQALQLFEDTIATQIIQGRCIVCHVDGYAPTQNTGLIFTPAGDSSLSFNYEVLKEFISITPDARDYILTKVSGGGTPPHQGGVQLPAGGTDYNNLASFIDALLTGNNGTPVALSQQFFKGVGYQSNLETLRRAAIILAGRAPYQDEIDAVTSGDDNTLRSTIRNLMVGDGFHEFLLTGANDRLLVRGTPDGVFLDGAGTWPNFTNRLIEIQLNDFYAGKSWSYELARYYSSIDRGLRDSPLELIAYVVENDLPYSEILTADYLMLNPLANFAVDGTATFNNPDDQSEFQPGRMENYVLNQGSVEYEFVEEIQNHRVTDPGDVSIDFPHAGILNTQSFLFRYPTTPTNRNRARARWTFRHFLDVDIEKSAQRTTDPVALADTNNPTLNNPACTVCHVTMDPVAGAFQNYGDEGTYRVQGMDSLDGMYKYGDNSPYKEGDTWYRDMRIPGIFGEEAPDPDNSAQWLAQQIVQEPGFARAAVKFWWPAVIGQDPLRLPEVEEDASYDAHLMAYDAQNQAIQDLADIFTDSGMNLKDLLVELTMSPWFRANAVDHQGLSDRQLSAHNIAALGSETLLTPERLVKKTRSLTGFGWKTFIGFDNDSVTSGLISEYGQYYGGIDSQAITERATEMTPLMSTVAMTHALQSACPIVLKDFIFADGDRRLFNDISPLITPIVEGGELYQLATNPAVSPVYSSQGLTLNLEAGQKIAQVTLENGFCDWDEGTQSCLSTSSLVIDSFEVWTPGSNTGVEFQANEENVVIDPTCSYHDVDENVVLDGACAVELPFTAMVSGDYTILANLAGTRNGADHPDTVTVNGFVSVNSTAAPLESTANGAMLIRQKLVDLHFILLGKTFDIDSSEIDTAYQLLTESWQERTGSDLPKNLTWSGEELCAWDSDVFFFDDLPLEGNYTDTQYSDDGFPWEAWNQAAYEVISQLGSDPVYMKAAWATVITYLLSHYHYLYE